MKLNQLIQQYVSYRKSLGEKFETNEGYLKRFCRALDPELPVTSVTDGMVHDFLYGESNKVTTGWFAKHTALLGLFQYALVRSYVKEMPMPRILPKRPPGLVPYVYSRQELKLLFETAKTYQKQKSHIDPFLVHTLLVLLYTLGLRISEPLSLTLNDIEIDNQFIVVRQSKFYKSRMVPFNEQVKKVLEKLLEWRKKHLQPQHAAAWLFLDKNNKPLNADTLRCIFKRIREQAGVRRDDDSNVQPRLHDLRHTFAVDRLVSWYREKKDVQQLLPLLSVYLGHTHLAYTSAYLTMTDDLLWEANACFEKYAMGGIS